MTSSRVAGVATALTRGHTSRERAQSQPRYSEPPYSHRVDRHARLE
jgi:hypothetical protein